MLAPDGTIGHFHVLFCQQADNTMVKAVARAFRWREMLENGMLATVAEIAAAERINEPYVGRILRLTVLTPDIVETILSGCAKPEITLARLMRQFSVELAAQRAAMFDG